MSHLNTPDPSWPYYTVVGYWDADDEARVTGVIRGQHDILGAGNVGTEGGPWSAELQAPDDTTAEAWAEDIAHEANPYGDDPETDDNEE